jgi:hypothetical protein
MDRFKVNEVEIREHQEVNIPPNVFAALALDVVQEHKEGL